MYPIPGWRDLEYFPFCFRSLMQQKRYLLQFKSSGCSINSYLKNVSIKLYVLNIMMFVHCWRLL